MWGCRPPPYPIPRAAGKSQGPSGSWETLRSGAVLPSRSVSGLHLPGVLKWGDSQSRQAPVNAFVDSGAAENLLDLSWALKLQLPIELNPSPRMVQSIDGKPIGTGRLTYRTKPVQLQIEDHCETIQFQLLDSPMDPMILGYPWLCKHEPQFSWSTGSLALWGPNCVFSCVRAQKVCYTQMEEFPVSNQPESSVDPRPCLDTWVTRTI